MDRTWCSVGCRHQLAAKPIIDMLVVVDSVDEDSYVPLLQAVGYPLRIREPDWHQPRLLSGPPPRDHLHVFSVGSPEIYRLLRFRDQLRRNPADRDPVRHVQTAAGQSAVGRRTKLRRRQVQRHRDDLGPDATRLARPGRPVEGVRAVAPGPPPVSITSVYKTTSGGSADASRWVGSHAG